MSRSADKHDATGAGDHLRAIRASLQSERNNHEPQAPEVQSRNQRPRTPEPKTADDAQPATAQPKPPSTLAGGELQRLTDAIEALTAKYEMEQAAHRQTLDLLVAQQQAHIDTLQQLLHQQRSST